MDKFRFIYFSSVNSIVFFIIQTIWTIYRFPLELPLSPQSSVLPITTDFHDAYSCKLFSPLDGEHGRVEQPIQDYQDVIDPEESTLQAFQAVPEDYQGQGKLFTRFMNLLTLAIMKDDFLQRIQQLYKQFSKQCYFILFKLNCNLWDKRLL